MRNILLILVACLAFSSCSTLRRSTASSSNVNTCIEQYPTVADLTVQSKVKQTVTWNFMIFNFGQPDLETRKSNLIAKIVEENSADLLLEPQYVYTKVPFGKRTLTVIGYPASFKDFRKATDADLKALNAVAPYKMKRMLGDESESGGSFFSRITSIFK